MVWLVEKIMRISNSTDRMKVFLGEQWEYTRRGVHEIVQVEQSHGAAMLSLAKKIVKRFRLTVCRLTLELRWLAAWPTYCLDMFVLIGVKPAADNFVLAASCLSIVPVYKYCSVTAE